MVYESKVFVADLPEQVSYFRSILYFALLCGLVESFFLFPVFAAVSVFVLGMFYAVREIYRHLKISRNPEEFPPNHPAGRIVEYAKAIALYLGLSEEKATRIHRIAGAPDTKPKSSVLHVLSAAQAFLQRIWFFGIRLIGRLRSGSQEAKAPLETRIVAVARAWDFLTWKPTRKAEPSEAMAMKILQKGVGVKWDFLVVAAFLNAYEDGKIQTIGLKYRNRIWKEEKITLEKLEKLLAFSPQEFSLS